jgi:HK97 family phage portal protein
VGRVTDILFGKRDAVPTPVQMVGFPSDGGLVGAGVTTTTSLGLSAVWACLDILSNGVSQLPWTEKRGTLDLPLSRIVKRPQAERTRREWVNIVVNTLALYDVCYLLKVGEDAEGVPLGLVYVQPAIIQPRYYDVYSLALPTKYQILGQEVDADQLVVLHRSPTPGIWDTMGGIINLARVTFAAAIAAEGYASRYWQAGGPTDRALETDANMPDTVAQEISERWSERRAKGPDHWPVLSGGLHAKQYGIDPTLQSAVEARREQVADIGRYFGIPTRLLNAPTGDSETYRTSEQGNQDLVRYTLQNYIGAIEDGISDLLPGGRVMRMDTRRLLTGTHLSEAQAFQLLTGNKAVVSVDEVRDWLDLPPIENPDELNPPAPAPVVAVAGGQMDGRQG